jgi:hypothetical protein
MNKYIFFWLLVFSTGKISFSQQNQTPVNFEQYIRQNIPDKEEINVFVNNSSWAKFDPDFGYILGNYMPHDGIDNSLTISTSKPDGTRTSFMYTGKPCRINTYGDSFTQGHQVSDGETWQEYLAAHLGEPIRNFGMGGYGLYQSYRRMLREEKTSNNAEYIMLYIWGDDHIRSLLRCRYMLFKEWTRQHEGSEGVGIMFHGNFWANMEMNLETGQFQENESRIRTEEQMKNMANPDWMVQNLKDDLALQMYLFKQRKISEVDLQKIQKLSNVLRVNIDFNDTLNLHEKVSVLLDKHAFAATKYILAKSKKFAEGNGKKVMIILFDPYNAMSVLLKGGVRYDQEIVDFLQQNQFNYFDMNEVHVQDYKNFNLSVEDYYKRYFIGHYTPSGNHFFAYSIKDKVVSWLNPKPITYRAEDKNKVDFKGYLDNLK